MAGKIICFSEEKLVKGLSVSLSTERNHQTVTQRQTNDVTKVTTAEVTEGAFRLCHVSAVQPNLIKFSELFICIRRCHWKLNSFKDTA